MIYLPLWQQDSPNDKVIKIRKLKVERRVKGGLILILYEPVGAFAHSALERHRVCEVC
jgi:hypothetical protein